MSFASRYFGLHFSEKIYRNRMSLTSKQNKKSLVNLHDLIMLQSWRTVAKIWTLNFWRTVLTLPIELLCLPDMRAATVLSYYSKTWPGLWPMSVIDYPSSDEHPSQWFPPWKTTRVICPGWISSLGEKMSCPYQDSNLRPPGYHAVLYQLSYQGQLVQELLQHI